MYKYDHAGHVITGNLNIVDCPSLQKIFAKGANYWIPRPLNWDLTLDVAYAAIDKYINVLNTHFKINDLTAFTNYKNKAFTIFKKQSKLFQK